MARIKPAVVIPVIIVLAIIVAVGFLIISPTEKTSAPSQSASQSRSNKPANKASSRLLEPTDALKAGSYIEYSDDVITKTKGEKLLFFHAQWCPQCRAIEADIKDGGIPDNTTIIKVDFDNSRDLRQKYGVTLQTTIVRVDDSGKEVKKFVAYSEPTLAAVIKGTR